MFIVALLVIAIYMAINRGMDKEDVAYIHNGTFSNKKNDILLLLTTWMDLEGTMLSEIS